MLVFFFFENEKQSHKKSRRTCDGVFVPVIVSYHYQQASHSHSDPLKDSLIRHVVGKDNKAFSLEPKYIKGKYLTK